MRLHLRANQLEDHTLLAVPGTYLAAALVRSNLLVAVTEDKIVHLRLAKTGVTEIKSISLSFPKTIACFACQRTRELFLVRSDGRLARGPWLP